MVDEGVGGGEAEEGEEEEAVGEGAGREGEEEEGGEDGEGEVGERVVVWLGPGGWHVV